MLKDVYDRLQLMETDVDALGKHIGLDKIKVEISDLEERSGAPDFWDDASEAQKVLKHLSSLKSSIQAVSELKVLVNDTKELAEMIEDDGTDDAKDIRKELDKIVKTYERVELETLLSGEHDSSNAIVEINSGARRNRKLRLGGYAAKNVFKMG